MNLSQRYRTDEEVTFQKLEDSTVLVHLGTGRIHHTNATGSRIWELLHDGRSLQETLDALALEFDAPPEQLGKEMMEFVEKLNTEKMISPVGASS